MIWRTEWWVVLFDTRLFQCVSILNLVLLPTLIDTKYWCKSLLGGRWTRTFGAMNANILEPRSITWRSELASGYTNYHLRLFFTWNTPDWSCRLKLHYFFSSGEIGDILSPIIVVMGRKVSRSFQENSSLICQNDDIMPRSSSREVVCKKCNELFVIWLTPNMQIDCRSIKLAAQMVSEWNEKEGKAIGATLEYSQAA